MDKANMADAAWLLLALVLAVFALRGELNWKRYRRLRDQVDAFGKAEADRETRRKEGGGPWDR